jgi:hypothetical protein
MPTEPTEQNGLHDHDDAPIIDGLQSSSDSRTPLGQESKPLTTEALRKIKMQREQIRKLQRQLQRSTEALQDSEQNNVALHDTLQATLNSPVLQRALETPGPHRLQERAQRPEDIAYQERLQQQSEREQAQQEHAQQDNVTNQPQMMLELEKQLAKAMKDTNTSDITEPSKFYIRAAEHSTANGWSGRVKSFTAWGTINMAQDASAYLHIIFQQEQKKVRNQYKGLQFQANFIDPPKKKFGRRN